MDHVTLIFIVQFLKDIVNLPQKDARPFYELACKNCSKVLDIKMKHVLCDTCIQAEGLSYGELSVQPLTCFLCNECARTGHHNHRKRAYSFKRQKDNDIVCEEVMD